MIIFFYSNPLPPKFGFFSKYFCTAIDYRAVGRKMGTKKTTPTGWFFWFYGSLNLHPRSH
ncbi:MAG: hypothetical protein EBS74_03335 [Flavobacteriia bacterium]|nr:hypothetical protein [Flavobacteriia bacterium]